MDMAKRAAKWIHRQRPFLAGFPYQDVKDLKVDEPDWKGLSDVEVRRLKAAAEQPYKRFESWLFLINLITNGPITSSVNVRQ